MALLAYRRRMDDQVRLAGRGTELETQEIREGKVKTKSLAALKKKYAL